VQSVKCQKCGDEIAIVNEYVVADRIAKGEYVKTRIVRSKNWEGHETTTTHEGVFGVCQECKRQERPTAKGSTADAQMTNIRQRVALVRERRPDLTLEQAVSAAVEDEFDPHNEPDPAFRTYLLGYFGAPDPEANDKARRIFEGLEGPHAGGAA
jgi:DNA-directed RNA polymerase subunit M/transcription elongation factor TFIIS